ncbi:MAG: hypothetical protein H7Z73_05430 [Candidatus Saccharibacteria bacterium]|nr:hypothetical protein [Moraxellaceae bacterium]
MIVFLDFDGVLHPDAVFAARNKPLELRAPGELFMHAPVLEQALAFYPEAKIILSTSWVRILSFERTLKKMPAKLQARVIGATWHKHMVQGGQDPFSWMTRFQQIDSHVKRNGIKNWVALDDLHSAYEVAEWPDNQRHRLVLTEQSKGLGCEEAQADLNTKLLEIQY